MSVELLGEKRLIVYNRRHGKYYYISQHSLFRQQDYPLQWPFFIYGLWAGVLIGGILLSPVVGFSVFTILMLSGMLWRKDEPPVLSFVMALQSLSVSAGYIFLRIHGHYPKEPIIGNIERAVVISLFGLIILSLGIRWGRLFVMSALPPNHVISEQRRYDVHRLFWVALIPTIFTWFVPIQPMKILFSAAQVIYAVLSFAGAISFLMFLSIIRQREGHRYAVIALLLGLLTSMGSWGSAFTGPFMLIWIALLSVWRPWETTPEIRRRNRRILGTAFSVVVMVWILGLLWEGGIKVAWRRQLLLEGVGPGIRQLVAFMPVAMNVVVRMDWSWAWEALIGRLTSGVYYFSHVLNRVPYLIPFEGGTLTLRAIKHIAIPRFLWPGKPNLGSDSWLIRVYAGLPVAGWGQGTSVGLGYIPEFYIDFGIPAMFIPLLLLGVLIGSVYQWMQYASPAREINSSAAAVLILSVLTNYDTEIAKLLGGFLMRAAVFYLVLRFLGPWMERKLTYTKVQRK